MRLALQLAQRGLGRVWPNPAVGCVIVDVNGQIASRGWTQDGGRPHAETEALSKAGGRAEGATVYVSLEPCAHHGQTGPCAQSLINARVARVVSAMDDPDPRVAGRGHAMLRSAGIDVRCDVLAPQARTLNSGFFSRIERGRPIVSLKIATTLDGKIALPSGESQWITGEAARAHGHLMRAQHDAVLVGIGTALADDPELTCRLPGVEHERLVRVIVDSRGRLPPTSKLAQSASRRPVWLLSAQSAQNETLAALNVKIITLPQGNDGLDLHAGLTALGKQGLTRVLVEGGSRLASTLLKLGLVDRILWYRAPAIMGDGLSAISGLGVQRIGDLPRFMRQETIRLGEDVLETYHLGT